MSTVSEKVGDMFLLARFQLDNLENQTSPRNVRKALSCITGKLSDIYDDTVSRIRAQCKERAELAMRVLAWIYHARRPLKGDELCYALSIEPGDDHLDYYGLPSVDLLLGVCCGFVSLDEESGTIRIFHYTAQEYLSVIHDQLFIEPEIDIARTCLTYLMFYTIDYEHAISFVNPRYLHYSRSAYGPFRYASDNWGYHLRGKTESVLLDLAVKFVKHLAADSHADLSLHIAAGTGLERVVDTLVGQGANIDVLNIRNKTPLYYVVRRGHPAVAKFLVSKGASTWEFLGGGGVVDIMRRWPTQEQGVCLQSEENVIIHSPVLIPLVGELEAISQMVLYKGLSIDRKGFFARLPATVHYSKGHVVKFKLSEQFGILVGEEEPLRWSVPKRFADIASVELFLDRFVSIGKPTDPVGGGFGETALSRATPTRFDSDRDLGGGPSTKTEPSEQPQTDNGILTGKSNTGEHRVHLVTFEEHIESTPGKKSTKIEPSEQPQTYNSPSTSKAPIGEQMVPPATSDEHTETTPGKQSTKTEPSEQPQTYNSTSTSTSPTGEHRAPPDTSEEHIETIPAKQNISQLRHSLTRFRYPSTVLGVCFLACIFLYLYYE